MARPFTISTTGTAHLIDPDTLTQSMRQALQDSDTDSAMLPESKPAESFCGFGTTTVYGPESEAEIEDRVENGVCERCLQQTEPGEGTL